MARKNEITDLKREIDLIKKRNTKVEGDKAWETSTFRTLTIGILTYIVIAAFLYFIGTANFWISALIPVLGFFLSTRTLPVIKKWWLKNFSND